MRPARQPSGSDSARQACPHFSAERARTYPKIKVFLTHVTVGLGPTRGQGDPIVSQTAQKKETPLSVVGDHPSLEACLKDGLLKAYPLPPLLLDADSKFQRLLDALASVRRDRYRDD